MLGTPSIRRYSFVSHPLFMVVAWAVTIRPVRTISRKLHSRDSCSIPDGWSVSSTVRVASPSQFTDIPVSDPSDGRSILSSRSQHRDARRVLDALVGFFGAGRARGKGPGSSVMVFAVDRRLELLGRVIRSSSATHPW